MIADSLIETFSIFSHNILVLSNKALQNHISLQKIILQKEFITYDKNLSNEFLKDSIKTREISLDVVNMLPNMISKLKGKNINLKTIIDNLSNIKTILNVKLNENNLLSERNILLKTENEILLDKITNTTLKLESISENIKIYNEKMSQIMVNYFENKNYYYLKTIEINGKQLDETLANLQKEKNIIKDFYEQKIIEKDKEIQSMTDRYRKELYDRFNTKTQNFIQEEKPILKPIDKIEKLENESKKENNKKKNTKRNQKKANNDLLNTNIFNFSNF